MHKRSYHFFNSRGDCLFVMAGVSILIAPLRVHAKFWSPFACGNKFPYYRGSLLALVLNM